MSNNQDGSELSSSGETDNNSTNWKLCCLCQKKVERKNLLPSKVTRTDQNGSGYKKNCHKIYINLTDLLEPKLRNLTDLMMGVV